MRHSLLWSVVGFGLLANSVLGDGKPGANPEMKPEPKKMDGKMEPAPAIDKSAPGKKSEPKLVEEVRPFRDPKPIAAAIDRMIAAALAKAQIPASPLADDAEFVRRVTLDIIGRVPTAEEALTFLESTDPQKRAQ